jgi:hypothetical protein
MKSTLAKLLFGVFAVTILLFATLGSTRVLSQPSESETTQGDDLKLNALEPEPDDGCAGVESTRRGGTYDCEGYLSVKARNKCSRRMKIEICIEKWTGTNKVNKKMDCGLNTVPADGTTSYWACDATGSYTIQSKEP